MKINSQDTTYRAYTIENKAAYIIALQKMLGISQSGKLDPQTRATIERFKGEYRIISDALVDFATFEVIKAVYIKRMRTQNGVEFYPFEHKDEFRSISEMLNTAIQYYSLSIRHPRGAVYGYDAIRAVARLRKIYRLGVSEEIDAEFFYHLLRDTKSINAMKKQRTDR